MLLIVTFIVFSSWFWITLLLLFVVRVTFLFSLYMKKNISYIIVICKCNNICYPTSLRSYVSLLFSYCFLGSPFTTEDLVIVLFLFFSILFFTRVFKNIHPILMKLLDLILNKICEKKNSIKVWSSLLVYLNFLQIFLKRYQVKYILNFNDRLSLSAMPFL